MSEPSPEPGRIRRMSNGISRWRNTRRGTKTLKAAYAQAARDAKRMDPVVRERIGRANLTKAELQMLAESQVAAQFGGQRHRDLARTLSQDAAGRVPDGRANRFSRWRATRRGTKAIKAAYAQAAKDVKKMDPAVRESIGRHRITRSDLQALSQGRMEDVFRPEGRMGAPPGAQQPQQQQPAQQAPLADQLRAAQLQLQATMLQNQQFQLQLESIQQQLLQAQLQTQQQMQALQQQLREAQSSTGPEAQTPTGPEAQAPAQPEAQAPAQPEAQAPAQPEVRTPSGPEARTSAQSETQAPGQSEVQNPDLVGQHAVVPDGRAAAQSDVQRPPVDQRQAWVASGTGQANHQAAPARPGTEGQQRPADVQAAAASNQQWSPDPSVAPDQSASSQADAKGKLTKEFDAAFTGQAPPRVSNGEQGRPAGERPAGNEHHRQTGQSTTRDHKAPER
ncbi:hypothetical protein E1218_26395 [Kribbella turkmenica]|uniref:Uncharacterized protein n=1 Tax=Kribbella turkmenica TaxID=2530375 RepID=A0A4R4WN41_9ACTN|nr:hypothetical protein [Kribbella turkmenica]TDD18254.1 hypothetical protein E1218_26395 [Kribbella turkmenica]